MFNVNNIIQSLSADRIRNHIVVVDVHDMDCIWNPQIDPIVVQLWDCLSRYENGQDSQHSINEHSMQVIGGFAIQYCDCNSLYASCMAP